MIEVLIAVLILLSLYHLLAIRRLKRQIDEAKDSFRNTISWTKEDLRNDTNNLRRVVRILAAGGRVSDDMVDEGKPFADISAADAQKLLSENRNAVVIDVRSPSEYMAGHIPGAKLIPLDELEMRMNEVPQAEAILVVCAGGTRSAAACDLLSQKGFLNLINIYDGTSNWPGQKEIGVSIRPPASFSQTNARS